MTSTTAFWTRPRLIITKGSSVCSKEEYAEARRTLDAHRWEVDYIITHSPPGGIAEELGRPQDTLTDFLEEVRQKARYRRWLFGHCHGDWEIDESHLLLWERIVRIV